MDKLIPRGIFIVYVMNMIHILCKKTRNEARFRVSCFPEFVVFFVHTKALKSGHYQRQRGNSDGQKVKIAKVYPYF